MNTAANAPGVNAVPAPADWFPLDAASRTPVPLFDVAAIRGIESDALAQLQPFTLMSRAGAATAGWLARHAPAGPLLFLAGPGNNGGDALVAATRLHEAGRAVHVWLLGTPERLPADAARAWREAAAAAVPVRLVQDECDPHSPPALPSGTVAVIDGLLGIGLNRPAEGMLASWIGFLVTLAEQGLPVFALDIPSGLFADTGGGSPAVLAARTLTFIAAKPGLLTLAGRDCAGEIDIAPIGLDYPPAAPSSPAPAAWLDVPAAFRAALPLRRHAANKGSFGSLAVIGGGIGMTGAPLLGARAALYLGAGRVHVGYLADPAPPLDPVHPELMLHPLAAIDVAAMSALVIGPGMGTGSTPSQQLAGLLASVAGVASPPPLVLDADALNLLAADPALATTLRAAPGPRVMTPHPLEAARLAGCGVTDIQRDRLAAARSLAAQWQAVIVLKGSGTVIAAPGQHAVSINATGNAGLATAGTGDVLAGMIGALLAQGMEPKQAALAAVWIHGRAAERLVAAGTGPAGLTASELYLPAREIFNGLMNPRA